LNISIRICKSQNYQKENETRISHTTNIGSIECQIVFFNIFIFTTEEEEEEEEKNKNNH
jgi:hypothetical protein